MSKLYVEPRKGGFGEAWHAVKFAFKNIKTWLPNQFWPAALLVICMAIMLNVGGQFFANIIEAAQQHQEMQMQSMQGLAPGTEMSVPPMSEDEVAEKMMGAIFASKSFVLLFLPFPLLLVATLMSTVRFMRYMVLGEGQEAAAIPKFSLGKRELKVLGWSLLVGIAVSLPISVLLPMALAFVMTSLGVDWTAIGSLVAPVASVAATVLALRFSFLRVSASCDHPTTFFTAWRQMKGIFGSFLWAHIALVFVNVLPLSILMGFVALPAMMLSKFLGTTAFAIINVVVALLLVVIWMITMAAASALLARYYRFATSE